MHTPEPRQPGVSVREAAIHFGTSESDIRRRIKRGELAAESIPRPGGTLLRVLLDTPEAAPAPSPHSEPPPAPETHQDAPAATTRLLDKLDERDETIRAKDATIERLHREVRQQAERAARAEERAIAGDRRADRAERDRAALAERLAGVERERDQVREAAERPWWQRWLRPD
jgi:hypothetical protein